MPPLRLALVTHNVVKGDGQGRVNYEIARYAVAAGHSVQLIAAKVAPELLQLPGIQWIKVSHGPLPTALLKNAWFAVTSGYSLASAKRTAQIVLANGAVTLGKSDVNIIHFVHSGWLASKYYEPGNGIRGLYHHAYTRVNSMFERRALRDAAHVVAVSHKVAGELAALGTAKARVIPNGVDTQQFAPGPSNLESLGLPKDHTIALFVGDITSHRKNLRSVLHALQGVSQVVLLVVGNSKDSPFPELARQLGLSERVLFVGFRRDVADLMRASDIFIFPSRYEPFGLVILEAMASGLPVIITQDSGASELIDDSAGIKIEDPDDIGSIRMHLRDLAVDREKRKRMGEAARQCALKLTWERMGLQYLQLFEEIARKKARASQSDPI